MTDLGARVTKDGLTTWTIRNPYVDERERERTRGVELVRPEEPQQASAPSGNTARGETTRNGGGNREGGNREGGNREGGKREYYGRKEPFARRPPRPPAPVSFSSLGSSAAKFFKTEFKAYNDARVKCKNKIGKDSFVSYSHRVAQRNGISKAELAWRLVHEFGPLAQSLAATAAAASSATDDEPGDDGDGASERTDAFKPSARVSSVAFSGQLEHAEDSDVGPQLDMLLVGTHAPTSVVVSLERKASAGPKKVPSLALKVARKSLFNTPASADAAAISRFLSVNASLRLNSDPELSAADALAELEAVARVAASQRSSLANLNVAASVNARSGVTLEADVVVGLVARSTAVAGATRVAGVSAASHAVVFGLAVSRAFGSGPGAGSVGASGELSDDGSGNGDALASASALASGTPDPALPGASPSSGLKAEAQLYAIDADGEAGVFVATTDMAVTEAGARAWARLPALSLSVYGQVKVPIGERKPSMGTYRANSSGKEKARTGARSGARGGGRHHARASGEPASNASTPVRSPTATQVAEPEPPADSPSRHGEGARAGGYPPRKPPPASAFDGVFPLLAARACAELGVEYSVGKDSKLKGFFDTNGKLGLALAARIGKAVTTSHACVVNLAKLRSTGSVSMGLAVFITADFA